MKNKVTVDFAQNMVTPSIDGDGVIMLLPGAGENVEKWAILLPQEDLEEGEEGSAYSEDGVYSGTRGAIPVVDENAYIAVGIFVTVETISGSHIYVDLGLPSGTLWATCNVGADSPEDYGDYFAWGETQPKATYNWYTYQYCNGNYNTLTKYCSNSSYGSSGFTDNLTTLLPEDDAATANWGEDWRMPTVEDWQELYNNTTTTWTIQNGVYGRRFVAANGNKLFLPAAGYYNGDNLNDAGNGGYYWSNLLNTVAPLKGMLFEFFSGSYTANDGYRSTGRSVRAVLSSGQN